MDALKLRRLTAACTLLRVTRTISEPPPRMPLRRRPVRSLAPPASRADTEVRRSSYLGGYALRRWSYAAYPSYCCNVLLLGRGDASAAEPRARWEIEARREGVLQAVRCHERAKYRCHKTGGCLAVRRRLTSAGPPTGGECGSIELVCRGRSAVYRHKRCKEGVIAILRRPQSLLGLVAWTGVRHRRCVLAPGVFFR